MNDDTFSLDMFSSEFYWDGYDSGEDYLDYDSSEEPEVLQLLEELHLTSPTI